ncbi:MAG: sigma-54 dependent transcriptional regulator [Polyangia bacterium]
MRHALITWTDRAGAPAKTSREPDAGRAPERAADRGPVLRLLEQPESCERYACIWVLSTPSALRPTQALVRELAGHAPRIELRTLEVEDPSDYGQVFRALGPLCSEIRRAHRGPGWSLDVLLSAGTPQAQTLWVILVQAGMLAARMLQVIPPQFVPVPHPQAVREVRLDIEGFPAIRALRDEVQRLRAMTQAAPSLEQLLGDSEPMRAVRARLVRLAQAEVPVLILGETGTGKELAARALHQASARAAGPFIAENCAAFAEGVLHSELFGHEAGAFTGATARRRGLFEQAHGGTLFLDEVGELPPRVQATLLRVLQEGSLRRVGGEGRVQVDVRVVAATHRDLKSMVERGAFREDLYYRLCGASVELPPLRARIADLPLLIDAFLDEARRGGRALSIGPEALRLCARYAWPGNVRELRAEVQRWAVFCEDEVDPDALSPEIRAPARRSQRTPAAPDEPPVVAVEPLAESLARVERAALQAALVATGRNLVQTARALGIDRNTLKRKLRGHGLYPLRSPSSRSSRRR